MTIEHHFILKFSNENGWEWDTETEEALYLNGTVWNSETKEWFNGYLGEGEYLDNDDTIGETLGKAIQLMNEARL